ncbi:hypothetical protein M426DRAFT_223073 [Hypoxylon sp. CI-4A]|nr:hypothetical protein M426DRAFT_223073 [Hypoxylon sp. CI-4A]
MPFGPPSGVDNEWYLIHRAGLHSAIKSLAVSEDGEGPPVQLFLSCDIVELDKTSPSITLRGGEKYSGDFIVGADGVNSWTRSYIAPNVKPHSSGICCYRWMGFWDTFSKDPLTADYGRIKESLLDWTQDDRRIVCYPCDNHQVANIAAFVPASEVEGKKYGWNGAASKNAMLNSFKSWGLAPFRILDQADETDIKVWELMDMEVLDRWTDEKLVLIGDAAHPFLPYMGQGGAMAIEDGVSLAAVLPRGNTPLTEIPERLRLFETCRRERANRVQEYTRRNGKNPNDKDHPDIPETVEMVKYCNNHDEWIFSTQALEKHNLGRRQNGISVAAR